MTRTSAAPNGIAVARAAVDGLAARLGLPLPPEARPGADLVVRSRQHEPWPARPPLLPTADGWVHPGPPTAWDDFVAMATALGAPPGGDRRFPDLRALRAEDVDAEAGAWQLPAVAVRDAPAPAPRIPEPATRDAVRDRAVVVLGSAWATPLVGLVLARMGAHVVRVDDPRRSDPFPLAPSLRRGQSSVELDLGRADHRDQFATQLTLADLLVDGHPPRVRDNVGLGDDHLAVAAPRLAVLRLSAFAREDRPGYGPAAECRGGWATRHDPPRLARSSVADPVAGLLGALTAVELLAEAAGGRARVSLEDAVGHLFAVGATDA